jgi:hypothetical protein
MNSNDCSGFEDAGRFLEAIGNWKEPCGPVTYLVVCDRKVSRLQGVSNILYVGKSEAFGAKNGRLWNYQTATVNNETEYRVREGAKRLIQKGDSVFLRKCVTPPNEMTIGAYESYLLGKYENEHWELPPFNHRK